MRAGSELYFAEAYTAELIDMATVTLKNVKKIYDNTVVAVQEFCLEIQDKEFVVLVGPSGCGKSTTLRMIAGLEEITEGELCIGDKLVNNVAPKDRDIAMVFQNYALYPHMTVYENMAFALKLRKMKRADIDAAVHAAAEVLDITEYLQRKPKALSGGQRQRVAIGRAIVREPQVFLMDEPLSNLDAKLRNQMRAEIIKLRERINTTFVYVTHDQTEAMTLGDRIVIMKDGFVLQVGTPHEVFHHPENLFVAGFIGSPQMNFFSARLEKDDDNYYVVFHDKHITLPEERQRALSAAGVEPQDITMGIRPEHIVVGAGPDSISGKLEFSEMMGSSVHLHALAGEQEFVIIKPLMASGEESEHSTRGNQPIDFTLPGAFLHLFDSETEKNIAP